MTHDMSIVDPFVILGAISSTYEMNSLLVSPNAIKVYFYTRIICNPATNFRLHQVTDRKKIYELDSAPTICICTQFTQPLRVTYIFGNFKAVSSYGESSKLEIPLTIKGHVPILV